MLPTLRATGLLLITVLGSSEIGLASTALDYRFRDGHASVDQTLSVQSPKAWIRAVGGNPDLDLLFNAENGQWTMIQHDRKSFTVISEKALQKLSNQVELLGPLVKGVSKQLGDLSPDQQQGWRRLLGNAPVEELSRLQKKAPKAKLSETQKMQRIATVPCHTVKIEAGAEHVEVCLADPNALSLAAEDNKTLNELSRSLQSMLHSAGSISGQLGFDLTGSDLSKLGGLPLLYQEGSGRGRRELKFMGSHPLETGSETPGIPEGYRQEKLKFW